MMSIEANTEKIDMAMTGIGMNSNAISTNMEGISTNTEKIDMNMMSIGANSDAISTVMDSLGTLSFQA